MKSATLVLISAFAAFTPAAWCGFDASALQQALELSLSQTSATGAQAAIVRGGQVLWSGHTGVIAPNSSTPVTSQTLFSFASVGKMMTGTLVLQLAEQGLLQLDTPVNAYLSTALPGSDRVTVRHLLQHTSGYADVYESPAVIAKLTDFDYPWSRSDLLEAVQEPLTEPGTQSAYSNTNFIILGEIVEHVGGTSFANQFQQRIVDPLGLSHLFVTPRPRSEFAQGVSGEGVDAVNYFDLTSGVPSALYGEVFGDGPAAGTALEVALFTDAVLRERLLGDFSLGDIMILNSGNITGHTGAWGGFTSVAVFESVLDVSIVTVTNHQPEDPGIPLPAVVIAGALASVIPEPSTAALLMPLCGLLLSRSRLRRT